MATLPYVPGTLEDVYGWYVADMVRTMATLLAVPTTSMFRAAALAHQYIARSGDKISPDSYLQDATGHLAAASLLAVAKVDCLPVRLTSVATVCDRVLRRRHLPLIHPPPILPELSKAETEQLRAAIVDFEWRALEASAFLATSEAPHPIVMTFVRAVASPLDASGVESALPPAAIPFLNYALAYCNDAVRSRTLMLKTPRGVIAAAALTMAAETLSHPLDKACPEWPVILGIDCRQDVNDAVASIKSVTQSGHPLSRIFSSLAVNPGLAVVVIRPAVALTPRLGAANPGATALAEIRLKDKKDKDRKDKDKSGKKDKRDKAAKREKKKGKASKKDKKKRAGSVSSDGSV
jgi:hypothetical protein